MPGNDDDDLILDDQDAQDIEDQDDENASPDDVDDVDNADDESGDNDGGATGEDDEDVITFAGTEARGEDEPEHIKDLRKGYREQQRRIRELEAKAAPAEQDVGAKPNIDDYWDKPDQFEAALLAWNDKKLKADAARDAQRQQGEALQREYQDDVSEFERQRASLRVRDFDAAQDAVTERLSEAQVAILTQVAKNKAALMYALGKSPDKVKAIAGITNLAKFAGEVARLDMETQVTKRKPSTQPEQQHRGSGGFTKGDARLDKLTKDAERSGDYTALFAYKRQLKARDKAA